MTSALKSAMKTSISEVMKTVFYLPVYVVEGSTAIIQDIIDINEDQYLSACEVKFSGDFSGSITLVIPNDLLVEITENFMGESEERLGDEYFSGTLIEMLNMISGNALNRVSENTSFKLSIPELIDISEIPASRLFTLINTPESMMAVAISVK